MANLVDLQCSLVVIATCIVGIHCWHTGPVRKPIALTFSEGKVQLEVHSSEKVYLNLSEPAHRDFQIYFTYLEDKQPLEYQSVEIIKPLSNITFIANISEAKQLNITGVNPGKLVLGIRSLDVSVTSQGIHISVVYSKYLVIINQVIGWLYFASWSISFYTQIYTNWRRKSVVGFSFDFLAYNFIGHLSYLFFNVCVYWDANVQSEYFVSHPRGEIPVQDNDVAFSIHAVTLTSLQIVQCLIYERGGQRVSWLCVGLVTGSILFSIGGLVLSITSVIQWLTYLYFFSYIKIGVNLIKSVPQAVLNYRRKSCEGFNIFSVWFDIIGGVLSILQMVMVSFNNDDWDEIFADPTKFGLGLLTIIFDMIFIVQRYILYRNSVPYVVINDNTPPVVKEGKAVEPL
ncbi:cystinosin [Lingula anatina]|uniref:Cystinosin homolog n=1 Tax=Lingula anatina TaxID=7574 RepID=A0A1S3IIF7_LINAN|nr:cystinosin [Lingula anatina]|eukprot:XP_013397284.1 cystinosin [Lingula anatina]